jgi:ATP-dependent protease HslVU (ClpYQ) peptidase subunit
MTTIVIAKKNGRVAIGADTLTTFGDTRLAHPYKRAHDKVLRFQGSWIAVCGSSAHHLVLESIFVEMKELKLGSRAEIFETFRKIHPVLKEKCFLNPKEEDDDPYESSQITALIANNTGIYGVYSYRGCLITIVSGLPVPGAILHSARCTPDTAERRMPPKLRARESRLASNSTRVRPRPMKCTPSN